MLTPQTRTASINAGVFGAFSNFSETEHSLLERAIGASRTHPAGTRLITAGQFFDKPRLIVSGWAFSAVTFLDGRRQIVDFFLPGDIIGFSSRHGARAYASYFALTNLVTASAHYFLEAAREQRTEYPALQKALLAVEEREGLRQIKHIVRLGRQVARERMASLILELAHRLEECGLVKAGAFDMPITQEILGDALGLSSVHVNRTLQELRREALIRTTQGRMEILNFEGLSAIAGTDLWEAN